MANAKTAQKGRLSDEDGYRHDKVQHALQHRLPSRQAHGPQRNRDRRPHLQQREPRCEHLRQVGEHPNLYSVRPRRLGNPGHVLDGQLRGCHEHALGAVLLDQAVELVDLAEDRKPGRGRRRV